MGSLLKLETGKKKCKIKRKRKEKAWSDRQMRVILCFRKAEKHNGQTDR